MVMISSDYIIYIWDGLILHTHTFMYKNCSDIKSAVPDLNGKYIFPHVGK